MSEPCKNEPIEIRNTTSNEATSEGNETQQATQYTQRTPVPRDTQRHLLSQSQNTQMITSQEFEDGSRKIEIEEEAPETQ